ncbi:MAG TPA: DUF2231 domain-containing protein [Chitinophagaceae bacterium]
MNQSQIHLALTHMPVVLSLTGLVILIISLIRKNQTGMNISFYILLAAGLFTIPVFLSGEGAEEMVERIPGVSEAVIEKHEDVAKISLWIILATALVAIAGLIRKAGKQLQFVRYFVLIFAIASAGLMVFTAHLGGQIRHTEISSSVAQNSQDGGEGNVNNEEDEDD